MASDWRISLLVWFVLGAEARVVSGALADTAKQVRFAVTSVGFQTLRTSSLLDDSFASFTQREIVRAVVGVVLA